MKKVFITGANGGIGLAVTKLFLESGYSVIAHYNHNKENLEKLTHKKLSLIQANFEEIDEVRDLSNQIHNIDILINNAGYYHNQNLDDLTNIDKSVNVNIKAPLIFSKKIIQYMKQNSFGRIINISSIGVKYGGSINTFHYTMSKSALETMTMAFAKEFAKDNILINALRVGITDTDIHQHNKEKNMIERIRQIPLQRMALPKEIAETVLFLASEKNTFITGAIIPVSGGE